MTSSGNRITPSRHSPWDGGTAERCTAEQERAAAARAQELRVKRAATKAPAIYSVRLQAERRPGDWVAGHVDIRCPVVTLSRNRRRILVIAPDGTDQWVDYK